MWPSGYTLTDLGETTSYLLELNIRPWKTSKRKETIAKICKTLGVDQDGGQLEIMLPRHDWESRIADSLVRLAQACIRVSDISLGYTLRTVSAFREEVEEFLDSSGFRYEVDYPMKGQFGKDVKIDFKVEGPHAISLVQTLSASNSVVASRASDDLFTKWYDVKYAKSSHRFLTVFDSSVDVFSETDILRLSDLSTVIAFPAEEKNLLEALAA